MDISSFRWKQKCLCYFIDLLRNHKINGDIYIDKKIINMVSCIVKYSMLLSCGIKNIRLINKTILKYTPDSMIILSYDSKDLYKSLDIPNNIKLFFYPKIPNFIVNEEYEILDLGFIPIDTDVLSLEDNKTLNIFGINGCDSNQLVKYLLDIFNIYGYPSNIQANGHISNTIANIIINKSKYDIANINWNINEIYTEQLFENLIIIDRVNDWDNFFQIGSNYESLLDYIYGIKQSRLLIDDNINNTLVLSEDFIFPEIKNKKLNELGKILFDKIDTIKKFYNNRNNLKTLSEFSEYVLQISQYKQQHYSIEKHIIYCQEIQQYLSNHIAKDIIINEIIPEVNIMISLINKTESNTEVFRYICWYLQKTNNKKSYDQIKNLLNYLPFDNFQTLQKLGIYEKKKHNPKKYKMIRSTNINIKENTMIFIIGGTTYHELFQLRQKYPKSLILTTNVWNMNNFYEAINMFE
ncbi:vacuolar sorting protein [Megavirus courdo11]|uniref:Vacuolar sorting protein n=1 Tax=Megavirus courdo11 TaxID=1128140 RepID=K7YX24_9VIRU|nr:vacuolar sorting protein [Megavirus courdo11]